jgi:hypothetical protein
MLSARAHNQALKFNVGKGHQQIHAYVYSSVQIDALQDADAKRAGYVLYRALVSHDLTLQMR